MNTVSDCAVSGPKPSFPWAVAALATVAGDAAATTDAHMATPVAPAIRHRTPGGREQCRHAVGS